MLKRLSDSPPRSKRSRSRYDRDDSRDRSPDYDRRNRTRTVGDGGQLFDDHGMETRKYRSPERERYHSHSSRRSDGKSSTYKSLCLTNISSKISDAALNETLMKEFREFGNCSVDIKYIAGERCAYVNYRYSDEARAAKHARLKLIIYERQVVIDAVRNRRRSRSPSPKYFPSREPPDVRHDIHPEVGLHPPHLPPFSYPPPGLPPVIPQFNRPIPIHPPPIGIPPPGRPNLIPPSRPPIPGGPVVPRFETREFIPPPRGPAQLGEPPLFRNFEPPVMHPPPIRPEIQNFGDRFAPFPRFSSIEDEDNMATRTLFVGNLDYEISESDLRNVFEKFGRVVDIDIKRPARGTGNPYAFVKMENLDIAHRAKKEMTGQYIGRFQCKIGYGKVKPTSCLWIGGLGPWMNVQNLEREFARFGFIKKFTWLPGKNYAHILYDNEDVAQRAARDMKGRAFGGPDKKIRIDFIEQSEINDLLPGPGLPNSNPWQPGNPPHRFPPLGRDFPPYQPLPGHAPFPPYSMGVNKPGYPTQDRVTSDISKSREHNGEVSGAPNDAKEAEIKKATTMSELAKNLTLAWSGALILKNLAFPACMYVVGGNHKVVDSLMTDKSSSVSIIRITQRLRLDDSKLDDVGRRITSVGSNNHCVLLALPTTLEKFESFSSDMQQRPLKNLISYLNKKDAAGVISLPSDAVNEKDNQGILYSFPPCSFGFDMLHKRAPNIQTDTREDHLMVVIIKGT